MKKVEYPNGDIEEHPWSDWDVNYLLIAPRSIPRSRWLMDLDAIKLSDLTEPDEWEKLKTYKSYRADRRRAARIVEQAVLVNGAAGAILDAAGVDPFHPPSLEQLNWLDTVLGHLNGVVWRLKLCFNRPRPYHVHPELGVLDGVGRPGHASYPSGHAAAAYTFAGLIGSFKSDEERAKLFEVADEVSRGREIAGVHFPSDTRAGEQLARILVKGMLESTHRDADKFRHVTESFK